MLIFIVNVILAQIRTKWKNTNYNMYVSSDGLNKIKRYMQGTGKVMGAQR